MKILLLFDTALVNKLVPSAWLSSGTLEVWRFYDSPLWQ